VENRDGWVVQRPVMRRVNITKDIILATINAKWIHPSLALRLLKANLGSLEDSCEIIEFALRQPLGEKLQPLLAAGPRILGISVSIWNHLAVMELLEELDKAWTTQGGAQGGAQGGQRPVVVLGGPEVSHLPPDADIFRYADHVIRGEGEIAFKSLCENILLNKNKTITNEPVDLSVIKSAYHLYTDEDLAKKLIYTEASRGCVFNCEFCLSAAAAEHNIREFPLEQFLAQMDDLVKRGAGTFKFLDRSININIKRLLRIIGFFLNKIEERKGGIPLVVHFEMVPSVFPPELCEALMRFPPGTLRLEIGIQTFNTQTAALIGRLSDPAKEMETLRFLREKTSAIIHADLIAGLPGEDIVSFGRGFDRLWSALSADDMTDNAAAYPRAEIQLGMLKLLPGALIARHNKDFAMRYSSLPPYEIEETSSVSAADLKRLKNFARFWELLVNRGIVKFANEPVFDKFMILSDRLLAHFGRNWGIDKKELTDTVNSMLCVNT